MIWTRSIRRALVMAAGFVALCGVPASSEVCEPNGDGVCNCRDWRGVLWSPQDYYTGGYRDYECDDNGHCRDSCRVHNPARGGVNVYGEWNVANRALVVEVEQNGRVVARREITAAATPVAETCKGCTPYTSNAYPFSVWIPLAPGSYKVEVHKQGNKCVSANPVSQCCWELGYFDYCSLTTQGRCGGNRFAEIVVE